MEDLDSCNANEASDPLVWGVTSEPGSDCLLPSLDHSWPREGFSNQCGFTAVHSGLAYDPLETETLSVVFDTLIEPEELVHPPGFTTDLSLGLFEFRGLNPSDFSSQSDLSSRTCCEVCCRPFENAHSLERHAKSSGHRAFCCPYPGCDKSYCRRDLWARHRRTHTSSQVLHICELCRQQNHTKQFSRKDHLRQHVRNCHPQSSLAEAMSASVPGAKQSSDSQSSKCSGVCGKSSAEIDSGRFNQAVKSLDRLSEASGNRPGDDMYRSRAIQDIVAEATRMEGNRTEALKWLRDSLDLKQSSTTAQLVQKIGILAARDEILTASHTEPLGEIDNDLLGVGCGAAEESQTYTQSWSE